MAPKTWYLYILECADGSLYTGIAVDVAARYAAHAAGLGARYTRSHPPVRLLHVETHEDRSAAAKAEWRIKQLKTADKWAYVRTASGADAVHAQGTIVQAASTALADARAAP